MNVVFEFAVFSVAVGGWVDVFVERGLERATEARRYRGMRSMVLD
jgi:hypothetical protein